MLGIKRKFRPLSMAATLLLTAALLVGGWGVSQHARSLVAADRQATAAVDMKDALAIQKAFVETARNVNPAVVSIQIEGSSAGVSQGSPHRRFGPGRQPNPEEWFRPFGSPFQPQALEGMGSGMIIRKEGYVITNNHVVQGARRISVRLVDEREYPARLIGTDPRTDVAVLKIDSDKPLPTVELGNSDAIEVGQWAMAVGNPFGFEQTVTVGVISAKGRETTLMGPAGYQDYIQTDASINPGNSGGPLVNLYGQVIGINNHIFSRNGGNVGIGFAVPINNAKPVIEELIRNGKVIRGRIGVMIKNVTPDLAAEFGLAEARGALVNSVEPGGPAEQAGVQPGDVILSFAGQPIQKTLDLVKQVTQSPVGEKQPLTVWREGQEITLQVGVVELAAEKPALPAEERSDTWGLAVQSVPAELAQRWKLPAGQGLLISGVTPGSSAEQAGLQAGDVILGANRQEIHNLQELRQVLQAARENGRNVVLRLLRQGQPDFLVLKPPASEKGP